jgi:hypothetical protein
MTRHSASLAGRSLSTACAIGRLCALAATARPAEHPFQDPEKPTEDRISDLVGRMELMVGPSSADTDRTLRRTVPVRR